MLTENADAAKSGISTAQANVQGNKAAVNAAQVEVKQVETVGEKISSVMFSCKLPVANLKKKHKRNFHSKPLASNKLQLEL